MFYRCFSFHVIVCLGLLLLGGCTTLGEGLYTVLSPIDQAQTAAYQQRQQQKGQ